MGQDSFHAMLLLVFNKWRFTRKELHPCLTFGPNLWDGNQRSKVAQTTKWKMHKTCNTKDLFQCHPFQGMDLKTTIHTKKKRTDRKKKKNQFTMTENMNQNTIKNSLKLKQFTWLKIPQYETWHPKIYTYKLFECLINMCFVFLQLHLFSAIEHVSHGKAL